MVNSVAGGACSPPAAPALPPVVGRGQGRSRGGGGGLAKPGDHQAFLSGLLNQDLQQLTKWHGQRPPHEQKRFLRSVDMLYKSFSGSEGTSVKAQHMASYREQQEAQHRQSAAAAAAAAAFGTAAEMDPLAGPPRSPRAPAEAQLAGSASAPSLPSMPIEVFEQKKRRGLQKSGGSNAGDFPDDSNTLQNWLEGMSVSSSVTGTTSCGTRSQYTSLSQMTRTASDSSICSEPGTTNQMAYRVHKRALAANVRRFRPKNQHDAGNLKDGLPTFGFPECERMQTMYVDQFGSRPIGENITSKMYESVFQENQHPFVAEFLETAPPAKREQFTGMVRSLQFLRKQADRETNSLQKLEYDLKENERLWKPPRARPMFGTAELQFSRVPLSGSASVKKERKFAAVPSTPPPPETPTPYSPSVSGLGSLPLTPRSIITPLVGGRDFPLMAPPPVGLPPVLEGGLGI